MPNSNKSPQQEEKHIHDWEYRPPAKGDEGRVCRSCGRFEPWNEIPKHEYSPKSQEKSWETSKKRIENILSADCRTPHGCLLDHDEAVEKIMSEISTVVVKAREEGRNEILNLRLPEKIAVKALKNIEQKAREEERERIIEEVREFEEKLSKEDRSHPNDCYKCSPKRGMCKDANYLMGRWKSVEELLDSLSSTQSKGRKE